MGQVIDFYNAGGGTGRGLQVPNQTLATDSLKLTEYEKSSLIAFITSLDEQVLFEPTPTELPQSKTKSLNNRKVGGEY
jgi:cytochrome c peroxidase